MILRGHEFAERGYEMLHGGRLCTVFSEKNYCGYRTNDAALLVLQRRVAAIVLLDGPIRRFYY
jgi:hypothetical protein